MKGCKWLSIPSSYNCIIRQSFLTCLVSKLGGGGRHWPKGLALWFCSKECESQTPFSRCVMLGDAWVSWQGCSFLIRGEGVLILRGHCEDYGIKHTESKKTLPDMQWWVNTCLQLALFLFVSDLGMQGVLMSLLAPDIINHWKIMVFLSICNTTKRPVSLSCFWRLFFLLFY